MIHPTSLPLKRTNEYAVEPALAAMAAHAVPGLDQCEPAARRHTRLVTGPHGTARVTVEFGANSVGAQAFLASPDDAEVVTAAIETWLGLDTDVTVAGQALAEDAFLAALIARRPGLRILGSLNGFETAVLTVLGQQVSLGAARTFGARLVARWGVPTDVDGFLHFPEPDRLAAADPDEVQQAIGLTRARTATVLALASAFADGLRLSPGGDVAATRRALLALRGIGPWTVEYLALRVLRDPDALPATDLVLRRALDGMSPRDVVAAAEAWRPWRAYAVTHLWAEAAYTP